MVAATTKPTSSTVSREQCRKARAWLGWTPRQLALRARVSDSTVLDYEAGKRTPIERNLRAITGALEVAGLSFENGGIAIKKPAKRRSRNGKPKPPK
jgi:transcriptional regulator with XRE-family HTH domain